MNTTKESQISEINDVNPELKNSEPIIEPIAAEKSTTAKVVTEEAADNRPKKNTRSRSKRKVVEETKPATEAEVKPEEIPEPVFTDEAGSHGLGAILEEAKED